MNLRGRAWILVAALAAQSCRGSSRESAAAPAPSPAFPAMPTVGPASGHATSAVFLLHGFGADGADLRSLAEALARTLPDAVFLLPDGFEAAPGGQGRQWFALADDAAARRTRLRPAGDRVSQWIDQELRRRHLSHAQAVVGGFSQGAMLALDVGLHLRPSPAGAFALSGRLVDDTGAPADPPPMLVVHGTSDARIPFAEAERTVERLRELHAPTTFVTMRGAGHTINGEAVDAATTFLHEVLR